MNVSISNICWSTQNLIPKIYSFDAIYSGCKISTHRMSVIDYFQIFFPESLMSFVVQETNKYHDYLVNNQTNMTNSRINVWFNSQIDEMYCFLATTLLMSRLKKNSYSEYWSRNRLIKTDTFSSIMSRDRYLNILKY